MLNERKSRDRKPELSIAASLSFFNLRVIQFDSEIELREMERKNRGETAKSLILLSLAHSLAQL
ncbi:MAG: hypothetical protein KAH24_02525 [Holophagae bacterium]|nr:hypothetical protein [Holophagae bacterium]